VAHDVRADRPEQQPLQPAVARRADDDHVRADFSCDSAYLRCRVADRHHPLGLDAQRGDRRLERRLGASAFRMLGFLGVGDVGDTDHRVDIRGADHGSRQQRRRADRQRDEPVLRAEDRDASSERSGGSLGTVRGEEDDRHGLPLPNGRLGHAGEIANSGSGLTNDVLSLVVGVERRRGTARVVFGLVLAALVIAAVAGGVTAARHRKTTVVSAADAPAGPVEQASQGGAQEAPLTAVVPNAGAVANDPAFRERAGKVVARGDHYVIEDVPLDAPTTVLVGGQTQQASSVLRITISGAFQVRDAAAIVSVNSRPLGVGTESSDLSKLVAFTFDRSVLTNGATLAYSYGLPGSARSEWSAPVVLAG
jgi:hypothetical protein